MRQILSVVLSRLVCDTELGAEKGAAQFGDQFFGGIGLIAEAFAELAITTLLIARPMGQFMEQDRVIVFRRG